jgi:hypothetical protein
MYISVGDNDTIVVGELTSIEKTVYLYDGIYLNDPIPSLAGSTDSGAITSDTLWMNESQLNVDHVTADVGGVDDSVLPTSTGLDIVINESTFVNESYITEAQDAVPSDDDSVLPPSTGLDITVTETVWANDSYANQKNAEAEQRDVTEVVSIVEGITAAEAGTMEGDGFTEYRGVVFAESVIEDLTSAETTAAGRVQYTLTQTYNQVEQEGMSVSTAGTLNSWIAGASLVDAMYFYQFIGAVDYDNLVEAVNATDSIPYKKETLITTGNGIEIVIESDPAGVWAALGATLLEDVNMNEPLLEALAKFNQVEVEDVLLDDPLLSTMTLGVVVPETVSFDDTPTVNQILQLWLEEQAVLFTGFVGPTGETYNGIVMNLRNKAITEYDSYDFNALGYWQGTSYGTKTDGIYRLEGANDAGVDIAAHILTAVTDFGHSVSSRVERAYLGVRNDGTLTLKVIARQDDDTKVAHLYDMTEVGSTLRRERVKLGKGVRAAYFQFELSNTAGGDFELDEMVLVPIALARRIT